MIQIFKRLIVSAIIPLFGGASVTENAQVVITVSEKTFLIQSLSDDGSYAKTGSSKTRIQLNFNANGKLIEESSNKSSKRELRLWGLFDPELFQLYQYSNGTARVKLGTIWEAIISTEEIQKVELVQAEREGAATIEVWIPIKSQITFPGKLTACP